MYSVILAAVDGSVRSRGVLDAALALAERFDGSVHLFRSVSVPPEFPAAAHMPPDRLPEVLEKEARQALMELAAEYSRVFIEALDMTTPKPWRAILEAAGRIQADLIVIGSHGHGGWDVLLGTNASKVADHADRSVLVVHERREAPASSADAKSPRPR
jgi:nucleotide-binding universal stress UspA family protein